MQRVNLLKGDKPDVIDTNVKALKDAGHSHNHAMHLALKHAKKGSAKKAPLGEGGRFAALKSELAGEEGVTDPGALAASIGRKKYGNKKFSALSAGGRKG